MKKKLASMIDQELIDTYKKACNWLAKRMQVTGTNKNELGEVYDHQQFLLALEKVEKMEDEMQKRGLVYG